MGSLSAAPAARLSRQSTQASLVISRRRGGRLGTDGLSRGPACPLQRGGHLGPDLAVGGPVLRQPVRPDPGEETDTLHRAPPWHRASGGSGPGAGRLEASARHRYRRLAGAVAHLIEGGHTRIAFVG